MEQTLLFFYPLLVIKMAKKIILIVDDEELILEELQETIDYLGYKAIVAINVEIALGFLNLRNDIDLIITDVQMPNKSGFDLISEVGTLSVPPIRCVIMSGHIHNEEAEATILNRYSNVVSFLHKPTDSTEIRHLLTHIFKK